MQLAQQASTCKPRPDQHGPPIGMFTNLHGLNGGWLVKGDLQADSAAKMSQEKGLPALSML